MDNLTIRSTVRRHKLEAFLKDIKSLYERMYQAPPEDLHIKPFCHEEGEEFFEVTTRAYKESLH